MDEFLNTPNSDAQNDNLMPETPEITPEILPDTSAPPTEPDKNTPDDDTVIPAIPMNPATPIIPAIPTTPAKPITPSKPTIPAIPITPAIPAIPTTPAIPITPSRPSIQPLPHYHRNASVRFLNAAYGYPSLRLYVDNRRVVNFLGYGSLSAYSYLPAGYQTITVTGSDGYIYLQKTLPIESDSLSTIAIVNRSGGIDLLKITDACCPPSAGRANFRVSNLARNSGPLDVLLADGRIIYSDVRFKETTAYKRIAPGQYEFLFAETNQLPAPGYTDIETLDSSYIGMNPLPSMAASLYLDVRPRINYTVFLLQSGQAYNAISTLVAEDR